MVKSLIKSLVVVATVASASANAKDVKIDEHFMVSDVRLLSNIEDADLTRFAQSRVVGVKELGEEGKKLGFKTYQYKSPSARLDLKVRPNGLVYFAKFKQELEMHDLNMAQALLGQLCEKYKVREDKCQFSDKPDMKGRIFFLSSSHWLTAEARQKYKNNAMYQPHDSHYSKVILELTPSEARNSMTIGIELGLHMRFAEASEWQKREVKNTKALF